MKKIIFLIFPLYLFNFSTLSQDSTPVKLQKIVDNTIDEKYVYGAAVSIVQNDNHYLLHAGNLTNQTQYFIASATKLYTTTLILKLQDNGKLSLSDKISKYLDESIMKGLHIYKGTDYSDEITIQHLLSNTSGLPDYFMEKQPEGISLYKEITTKNDKSWTFEEALSISKKIKPKFKPWQKNKGHYSDTNFQLLGKIIENITKKTLSENYEEMIFQPLGLKNTYLYQDFTDKRPKEMYFKKQILSIPKAMTSFGVDGGIVSTSEENLIFLKAFFEGKLFSISNLSNLYKWNKVMYPLEYGVGIMKFSVPGPFKPIPYVIGHSGHSGAFSFYCPEKNIYITGTVNQIDKPNISFKLMVKLISSMK